MHVEVSFPGGVEVTARYRDHIITTDQPIESGGGGSAPAPFDLFIASLATCAGYFALRFCRQRSIDTAGLAVTLDAERDQRTHMVTAVHIGVALPEGFPDRYREAMVRAIDQCTVKRHLLQPPRFEIALTAVAALAAH